MITDIEGNTYKTVKIGSQEWLAENLNTCRYRNGDIIPQVRDAEEWKDLTTGAWCYSENDAVNGKAYGKLYNWYAVNDSRGLAPEGWHIPTKEDWKILIDFLGGEIEAGGKLKDTKIWKSPNKGATNESGFSAIPGGIRNVAGIFNEFTDECYFWSASESSFDYAYFYNLSYLYKNILGSDSSKKFGLSVRCLKDS